MLYNNEGVKMTQTTAIITKTNGDDRDYHKRPIE